MASKPTDRRTDVRRVAAERAWYLAVAAVAVVVIAVALVSSASVSPVFCSLCHRSEVAALASSTHRTIACDRCHTGSSTFGVIESRLRVIDMIAWQFVPSRQHVAATIDSKRCLMCHTDDIAKTIDIGNVRMSHKEVIDANWPCQRCHVGSSHNVRSKIALGYTMDTCLQCHSTNAQNIDSCQTCHATKEGGKRSKRRESPWAIVHGTNWKHTHGMGNLATCKACHVPGYCIQCHNVNVPHPDGYSATHGPEVLARANGSKDCMVCHKQTTCDNCHGLTMPHPEGFAKSHPTDVKKSGKQVCETCHDQKSCDSCHVKHTHPGLPVKQRTWLQDHLVK